MALQRPLPVETLLPFDQVRSSETRAVLQDVDRQDSNNYSQSPDSQEDDDASGTEKPKRQKRSRACVACRNMKIRCLPVEGQEACNACSKVNRQCIMPGPPRKRQKTVHKVAELEKKINALTDALLAKQQQTDGAKVEAESPAKDAPTTSSSEPARTEDTSNTSLDSYHRAMIEQAFPSTTPTRYNTTCGAVTFEPLARDDYVDVVDRGDLTVESATKLFSFWRDRMCETNPIVIFPPGADIQEIRKARPMTFLAILTAASAVIQPSAQPALTIELNRQISERVLFHGDKSLDLIQAMLFNSQYYVRPRTARDMTFNHNIQAASVMALELGIGKRSKVVRSPEEEVEFCRTWLACYQSNITVTTILRLPSLVRFGPRVEECLETLSKSPYAAPSDKWLCATVGLARIAEEVSAAFDMDDPGAELKFTEPRIQHQLKCFQRQLRLWEKTVDVSIDPRFVRHHAACINLYIHEIAIHQDHNVDDFRPAAHSLEERKQPEIVTAAHVEALSTLLTSSHQVLDTYLSLDSDCARTLSNLYIVWASYAIMVLMKLHWIFNSPESKFGAVFLPDLRTNYYLDALLGRLSEISANGKNPCAAAFGFVFTKLKMWHLHRTGQLPDEEAGGGQDRASSILAQNTGEAIPSAKRMDITGILGPTSNDTPPATLPHQRPFTPGFMPGGNWNNVESAGHHQSGQNLNAAYDAASYGRTNWDQFNFSTEELDMFDIYMNNSGWMGYLL
ncbi:hypothetical protein G647_02931 [Cladophialophora carrionii CBS 160.54]|uniref:Zn(2)-C6 fungal-type domain-containing protein n=1 Tax=Cladophialophora carrionii CBS 160.54 TaxID=1279043 RepID=V9DGX8_9EURO|nr:uncharacterized protein G647_02931 [Cladophialophora carrionii CBS 160.54]ETI26154.1 hypothetical protein G647_02931 [Cladophialophora carrionii CBS 160.54]